jgi:hypothetical protein
MLTAAIGKSRNRSRNAPFLLYIGVDLSPEEKFD